MPLRLSDGTTIIDLSQPLQGTRHRLLFGVEESSGREVAAKIELIAGALAPERQALEWLTSQDGPAPRLHAAGTLVSDGEFPGADCLVIDRIDGETPSSPAGWGRLGRALARLSLVPWQGSDLTTLDHHDFLALHERRVDDLSRGTGTRSRRNPARGPSGLPRIASDRDPRRPRPGQLPRRRSRRNPHRLGGRAGRAPRPRPRPGDLHRFDRLGPRGLRRARSDRKG